MIVDRYTKMVLTVIAVALAVIAVRPWLPESRWLAVVTPGPALAQLPGPKYEFTMPRAWGKFIAFSNNTLLLEAPDQTWRIIDTEGRPPEYPKLKTLIHWQ